MPSFNPKLIKACLVHVIPADPEFHSTNNLPHDTGLDFNFEKMIIFKRYQKNEMPDNFTVDLGVNKN